MPQEVPVIRGVVGDIGESTSFLRLSHPKAQERNVNVKTHEDAFSIILSLLSDVKVSINCVGHRIVHGGGRFESSVIIDEDKLKILESFSHLAPLHMPYNIEGVHISKKVFGDVPQIGVFDTAFHASLPERAYVYPIPYEFYRKFGIRRFGFHGISYRYVVERLRDLGELKDRVIICHLGNGASITAVLNGRSVDTSMGFTPMEGLMMGTRCGDVDPGIIIYLMREKGYSWKEIDEALDKNSGLKGLSGKTYEMKEVERLAEKGDERAALALDVYVYRVAKYVGAYTVPLGGLDTLVFTGGIGENSYVVREMVCEYLRHMGVTLDQEKNRGVKEGAISRSDSKVKVMVIPTNEELMIARDCFRILSGL